MTITHLQWVVKKEINLIEGFLGMDFVDVESFKR